MKTGASHPINGQSATLESAAYHDLCRQDSTWQGHRYLKDMRLLIHNNIHEVNKVLDLTCTPYDRALMI